MRYKISFKTKKDFYDILEYINRYEEVVLFTISIYRKTISLDKVSSELRRRVEEVEGQITEDNQYDMEELKRKYLRKNPYQEFLEREKELNLHQKRKVKVYDENGKLIGEQG